MVSPSGTEVAVSCGPYERSAPTVVTLLAFFGNGTPLAAKWGDYRRIKIEFDDVVRVCYYPEYNIDDRARINGYDWSQVPEFRDEHGSLAGAQARLREAWCESEICPSPSAYEVSDSEILARYKLDPRRFKHFLIAADDFNVEVIAGSWRWSFLS